MASKRAQTQQQDTAVVEEKGAAVVAPGASALPAHLRDRMQEDAGKGASTAAKDNIVPMIYILQGLSPQVNPKKDQYIEGAAPGSFWLRNSPMQLVDGDLGFAWQQCGFEAVVVEWVPRDDGGGFVARHEFESPDQTMEQFAKRFGARAVEKENSRALKYITERGTELVDTKYHYGIVWGGLFGLEPHPTFAMPYVLPMQSTKIRASRELNFMINNTKIIGEDGKPLVDPKTRDAITAPAWAKLYRLRTRAAQNKAGEFAVPVPDDPGLGWVDEFMYERGARLHKAVAAKEVRAEDEVNVGDNGSSENLQDQAREAGI